MWLQGRSNGLITLYNKWCHCTGFPDSQVLAVVVQYFCPLIQRQLKWELKQGFLRRTLLPSATAYW